MIQRLVALALKMPFIVLSMAVLVILAGLAAYNELDIEAYPNPVPPLVEIITQPDGWSAEEAERYVTIPLEIGLAGMQGLEHTRSQSLFGLSDVKCYFDWDTTYEKARQEVINRLGFIQLPTGMQPTISPWNAIGEVFRYSVQGNGYTTRDLKTAEDWILEKQFKQVPGVIDVVSFGGESKQYHVAVDPYRLRGQGMQLSQLHRRHPDREHQRGRAAHGHGRAGLHTVRGIGLFKDVVHDIENVVITEQRGVPTRVKDIGNVEIGAAPRLGIVGHDNDPDIVEGIVLMRYGGETAPTLQGVYKRIAFIRENHILPPGMDIVPYYDRGNLVKLGRRTRCSRTCSWACCWCRSCCSCSWGTRARRSSRRSISRSRSSSRSAGW